MKPLGYSVRPFNTLLNIKGMTESEKYCCEVCNRKSAKKHEDNLYDIGRCQDSKMNLWSSYAD